MYSFYKRSLKIILSVLLLSVSNFSQLSDRFSEIKKVTLNSNAITTTIFNSGSIGAPHLLPNVEDLAWKKLGYMYEFAPIIAARVMDKNGDSVTIISDSHM